MHDHAALGLLLYPEFITETEEADALAAIARYMPKQVKNVTSRNAIVRFGCNRPFKNVKSLIIPEPFARLCEQLAAAQHTPTAPDAVTINEYYPKQTIGPHIDPPQCGPVISVLSLAAPATMIFTKDKEPPLTVLLPPRSLVQMRDIIRYDWRHEIQPVTARRYSVVFRCSEAG